MTTPQGSQGPVIPEPGWVSMPGIPGGFTIDEDIEATWVRQFDIGTRPTWAQLAGYGKVLWDHLVNADVRFATDNTGSRIVATMCYSNKTPGSYTIFQSTIPRGKWRTLIVGDREKRKEDRAAPRWCRAAYKPTWPGADTKVLIHAEDSAAFLCERAKRITMGWHEVSRMVPYGHNEAGVPPAVIPTCQKGKKQPTCTEVCRRLHIQTALSGATLEWMETELPKYPHHTAHLLTFPQYQAKLNSSGHSSGSDELDNVLKVLENAGYKGAAGRYTYRGRIPVPGEKKVTLEEVIVDPYGIEHEGKLYFCFIQKGGGTKYLSNAPSVDTSDSGYNWKKAERLYRIAEDLYSGKLAPASWYGKDDDEWMQDAHDDLVLLSQSGAHAGPSTTTGSRPASRPGSRPGSQPGSRPGSRGSATGQPPAAFGYSAHQQQYSQQQHPQQQHPQPQHPQHYPQQQHHYQQQHPQQYPQQHFGHASPSQQAPTPATQSAATRPTPQWLAREGKNELLQVVFDQNAGHHIVQGVSDSKPDKSYQVFWSAKKSKFYILKTGTDIKGKKTQEPVFLRDRTQYK